MTNIVRREPYAVDDLFDDLMKGFFVRPMRFTGLETEPRIKLDVKEDDKAYTIHAEMPGVKKEDIHVTLEGGMVFINAEVKREEERKEGEKIVHGERYYGKVSRGFNLAQEVDEAGAKARFENGVLELSLPKKAPVATRHLAIE
jgi:HSP20 family protein